MRRLRGIAASARVLHSPTSGRTTTLQELPTGGLEGGAAAAGGGLAADASTSSSYGSLSSSGSSEGGGFPGSPGFSFPLVSASDERDPLFEDDDEEQQARDLMRRWKETRSHLKIEKSELLRSVLLFINVVAQIVLTVVALEYQWDGQTLKNSSVSVGLRTAISALTVVLVIQMVEDDAWKIWKDAKDMRKRAKHAKEDRKKGRFAAAMGEARRQLTHRRFYLPLGEPTDYSFHTPTWMILMEYLPLRFYLLFTLRVLLCLPHIAPFLNDEFTKLAAMLTFLKLFVLMSVLRHFNPIYRNRHLIIRIPGSSLLEMPRFTTWFSTRTFYHQYPLTFSLSNIIAVVTTTAYGMYIYEREAQPHVFNYKLCLVIAVENLITGWPGDVFSQYTLESDGGRTFSIFASLGGLFFFALLINFLYIKLSPSSNDSHVVDWIARLKLEDKEKHEAAKLIQLVWRHRVDRRKREEEQVVNGDHERHYRFITVPSEKAYQVRFRRQCREMRHVRRKLVELYGRTGDGLETHPPPAAEKTKKKKKKMKRKSSKDKTKGKGRRHSHSGHVHSSLYKHSLRIIPTKLEFEGLEQQGAIDVGGQLSQEDSMNSDSSRDSFALVERQHEWEIQRARLRTYYAKAAKNLNKLMDELDR